LKTIAKERTPKATAPGAQDLSRKTVIEESAPSKASSCTAFEKVLNDDRSDFSSPSRASKGTTRSSGIRAVASGRDPEPFPGSRKAL